MNNWYCFNKKSKVQKVLDYFEATNIKFNNYAVIANVNEDHCIFVKSSPKHQKKDRSMAVPCICIYDPFIDEKNSFNNSVHNIGHWFAKYFGLHLKEKVVNIKITKKDMQGHDLHSIKSIQMPEKMGGTDMPSITKVDRIYGAYTQTDTFNCGIYTLIKAQEDMSNKQILEEYLKSLGTTNTEAVNDAMYKFLTKF